MLGTVRRYNEDRRFGFIEASGVDHFFHHTDLAQAISPRVGMPVSFVPAQNARGPVAN